MDETIEEQIIPEVYDWNTSLLSEICREGDVERLRFFIEYSRQMISCAVHASEIVDRLDLDTGLSPLHHAARYQQLHVCLMLLSNIKFEFGVNIKDENEQTPMHSVFRSSKDFFQAKVECEKETYFGNKLIGSIWEDLFSVDHPLVYLFVRANGDINAMDKYLLTPLHCAVTRNNLLGVKQLIALKAKMEVEDRQKIRPFHLACREGHLSIAEYLIDHGVEIDPIDGDAWTPMHHACAKGHLEIVKLFNAKAKDEFQKLLRMKTNTDATCLHLAVQNGNIQFVEYILTKFNSDRLKIYINQQAKPFGTPLHIAAKFSEPAMLALLVSYGADPSIVNLNGQSSLHIACASNRLSIVQKLSQLTQTSLLEIQDQHGQTAVFLPTRSDIIEELITCGADISVLDHQQMNPIMTGILAGQTGIVSSVLSAIDDRSVSILDQVDKRDQRSVFLLAVQTGSIPMCSLLLTHPSIRWDTVDKYRLNAFHIAAQNNHHQLIRFLCNHIRKCDKLLSMISRSYSISTSIDSDIIPSIPSSLHAYLNAQNEDGQTPLHFACEHGHQSCIKILVQYGADIFLANSLGQLPFHTAVQHGHSASVAFFIEIFKRNTEEFQSILSRKQSPLLTACRNGFADIVRILLTEDIGTTVDGNPLEIAIQYRRMDIIDLLLEHPHMEHWLLSMGNHHQTPLRNLIRYLPSCAQHAMDKLILKTTEFDVFGEKFQRTVYRYKYIDDYFIDHDQLYTINRRRLYENHPLIIALDNHHDFLLEHPLVKQLLLRKWRSYRWLYYLPRVFVFVLLLIFTCYVSIIPRPMTEFIPIRWVIIVLSSMNFLKIFVEIFLFGGCRVPFAQLFALLSLLLSIIAVIPMTNPSKTILAYQWQLAALGMLFQWLNIGIILRSVSFFGTFLMMFELILQKLLLLFLIISPLLIGFSISFHMMFSHQASLITVPKALHRISAMLLAEFDYETLFHSKRMFSIGSVLFILFILLLTMAFMNLLLGITVGDIRSSMANARIRANAYWIRELIYIESIFSRKFLFPSAIIEEEIVDNYIEESDHPEEENPHSSSRRELDNLLALLNTLCTQTKQVFDYELHLQSSLEQLFQIHRTD